MFQVEPEVLTDKSVVWNVTGRDEFNDFKIGCYSKRQAQGLSKALNNCLFIEIKDWQQD